ncbi:MAG: hypothetical protein COV34_02870 [Candidatus Zambryskibacteria bacterium CG10_big_fil_rev_8_21_14_0_10_42_12]|uniref:Dienelactone hydrolase domain-containing protein n=1 Tax=Candidatus Zambryskibacteria bacterium CG10_big_fil_rev_8_21_14_0_10_42_12 TaxID=1975115 RepID=A0A2H0QWM1_9BACT|nr:MAG: hypothetical protein COV34_02870 [Candidatus Zambryskibacteria bacterium CG10_big_fil_rev_8_21_14_0_10_42_12]
MKAIFIVLIIALVGLFVIWRLPVSEQSTNNTDTTVPEANTEQIPLTSSMRVYFEDTAGYFVRPDDEVNYPGVVMIHEWWGLNEHIKREAENLAQEGYQVLAVDLYDGEVAETPDRARELSSGINQARATENLRAATTFLRREDAPKVASLGWCFGGGQSLNVALSGESLDATVIYYGRLNTNPGELGRMEWPVLGIFGAEDTSIPVATVREFEEALGEAGVPNEIHVYDGVGHAFANPSGDNYARSETQDAWQKTLTFLRNSLKQE